MRAGNSLASTAKGRLYERPAFRAVAGVTLRPGGEALTRRGLELCGLLSGVGNDDEDSQPRDSRAEARGDRNSPLAVLDVGCGVGATAILLASLGFRSTGVDPSPDLLKEAAERAELLSCPFSPVFLPGRADNLPVADASQDAVVCECVLSLTPDLGAALSEMARTLRADGKLLLSDVYIRFPLTVAENRADHTVCNAVSHAADNMTSMTAFRPRSSGSCLEGAMPVEALRALLARQGFQVLAEEDHSRALAELAARLVLGGGSVNELASWLGASCATSGLNASGSGQKHPEFPVPQIISSRDLLRRLGYILLVARKA